jgi:hypothetical protein
MFFPSQLVCVLNCKTSWHFCVQVPCLIYHQLSSSLPRRGALWCSRQWTEDKGIVIACSVVGISCNMLFVLNRNKMDSCVFFARSKTIPNNNFSCILLPGTQLSSRCTWSKNLGLAIRHNILAEHTISFRPETCYSHVSSEPKEVKWVICQKFWQWENQIVRFFSNFCQKADATHDWTLCRFTYNCLTSLCASLQQFSCHWFCVDMISAFLTQNEFGGRGHISRVFGKFRRQEIFVSQDVGNICVQCNHVDSV